MGLARNVFRFGATSTASFIFFFLTWFSKISSILLESAGWFIGNIKISGTTRDPVYTVTPVGVGNILNKVKKTIDKVIDVLK